MTLETERRPSIAEIVANKEQEWADGLFSPPYLSVRRHRGLSIPAATKHLAASRASTPVWSCMSRIHLCNWHLHLPIVKAVVYVMHFR